MHINTLEDSVVVLDNELQRANGSLNDYLATRLTLLINAYYLNLSGSLDNPAWATAYHRRTWNPIDENDKKRRRNVQLMGKDFLKAIAKNNLRASWSNLYMPLGIGTGI